MTKNSNFVSTHSDGSSSSKNKSSLGYTFCDIGLVLMQRMLICFAILMGYDLAYAPEDLPHLFILYAIARIVRNFFHITKGVRKWLAIHYNEGIIPTPPIPSSRSSGISRSTPRDSCLSNSGISLKHSPIERRYSEPAHNFDLATAIKEQRNRSDGMEPKYRYPDFSHSSDFFNQHSLSFRFILNGLAQSFVGYIEDPDEEINKVEAAIKKGRWSGMQPSEVSHSCAQTDISENKRRADEVVQSILDHDAEQQRQQNSTGGSIEAVPLTIPDMSVSNVEQTGTYVPKPKCQCVTVVRGGQCQRTLKQQRQMDNSEGSSGSGDIKPLPIPNFDDPEPMDKVNMSAP